MNEVQSMMAQYEIGLVLVQIVVIFVSYIIGRYILPTISKDDVDVAMSKFEIIVKYADKFVAWANYFMKGSTGSERMQEVVRLLLEIAEKYHIDITEVEITAIAQKAYDTMKAAQKAAEIEEAKVKAITPNDNNQIIIHE